MSFDNSTNLVTLDGTVYVKGEYMGGGLFYFILHHDEWGIPVRAVGEDSLIKAAYEKLEIGQSLRVSGKLVCEKHEKDGQEMVYVLIESNSITIKEEPKEEHFDEETMKAFLKEVRMG